jgi:hypothetical protein
VAVAAEDIAKGSKVADLVWNEAYFPNGTGFDVYSQLKRGKLETVVPVLAGQFQHHGHTFPHCDFARIEFEG